MRTIHDDRTREMVEIDGTPVRGWIGDAECEQCNQFLIYHDAFDAFFCADCNAWKESRCSDPSCNYCRNRPDRPLDG